MSKTTNNKTTGQIFRKLETLNNQRETWESGAYKDSNDELYGVLDGCYKLLVEIRKSRANRKELERYLVENDFTVRANTSLEVRLLRAIFNAEGRRELGYKRLLDIAKAEKPQNQTLAQFIYARGGIDEIRRTPKGGISPSQQARSNQETAERELATAKPIGDSFEPTSALRPSTEGTTRYSVALVREEADGQSSIVWATGKQSVVVPVLKNAGKEITEQHGKLKVATGNQQKTAKRQQIIKASRLQAKQAKAA